MATPIRLGRSFVSDYRGCGPGQMAGRPRHVEWPIFGSVLLGRRFKCIYRMDFWQHRSGGAGCSGGAGVGYLARRAQRGLEPAKVRCWA